MPDRSAARIAGQFLLRFLLVLLAVVALAVALILLERATNDEPAPLVAISVVISLLVLPLGIWMANRFFARPLAAVISRVGTLSQGILEEHPSAECPSVTVEDADELSRSGFAEVFVALDRLDESLSCAQRARQQLDQEREQWIAGVSHDLKTPLSAIRGYAHLLASGPTPAEEVQRQANAILERSLTMQHLLADLELTMRIRVGALVRNDVALDAVGAVRSTLSELATDTRSAGRSLRLEASRDPVVVLADEELLRRAVTNLILNAVTHNPEGTTVTVSVFSDEGSAKITIEDDGVGMGGQLQPQRSDQLDPDTPPARSDAGDGLGMSVSRQFVELYGGSMSVESQPRRGTRVTLLLPLMSAGPS